MDLCASRDFFGTSKKLPDQAHPDEQEFLHCAAKLCKKNDALLIEMIASLNHIRHLAATVLLAASDTGTTALEFTDETACDQAASLVTEMMPLQSLLAFTVAAQKFEKFIKDTVAVVALQDLEDSQGNKLLSVEV